jgi:VWFA-related protein
VKPLTTILLAASLVAQNVPDATPTFQTGTRLVEVDVVVQDRKGAVAGLTKTDFTVLDNGVPQTIAIFSVREMRNIGNPRPLPAGVVTNRPLTQEGEPVAATVILFDRLNTRLEHQAFARLQALKYLQRASRNEQIAVYALNSKLTVLQNFTNDRDRLTQAVNHSAPEPSLYLDTGLTTVFMSPHGGRDMGVNGNPWRQDLTIAAFAALARHLSGLPGRKKLVWITENFPMSFTGQSGFNDATIAPVTNPGKLDRAIRELNNANIGVYPVDPRGVGPGLTDENISAISALAKLTGGKAIFNGNDVAAEIGEVMADTDLTYTLGFYPSEEKLDGKFHSIAVHVNRPGVEVRSRRGYSASPPAKPLTEERHLQFLDAWFQEPLEATDLSVRALAKPIPNRPGYYQVEVTVDPSELQLELKNGRRTGSLDLGVVPDVEHRIKGLQQTIRINLTQASYLKALAGGITLGNTVKVTDIKGKPLAKNLRVILMDATSGKVGSVRVPIGQ